MKTKINRFNSLTKRQLQILSLVASGDTSREIARKLRISRRTVDVHRSHIRTKLKTKSVANLVKIAIKNKLVEV